MNALSSLLEAAAASLSGMTWSEVGEATLAGLAIAAVGAVLLVVGGPLLRASRSRISFDDRQRMKQEIVFELRRTMAPTSAVGIAAFLKLDVFDAAALLEQLEREGLLESYTTSNRLTSWRVKGLAYPRAVSPG